MNAIGKSLLALTAGLLVASSSYAASTDLTAAGSSATINGAIYTHVTVQPAGTGFIRSFVRLQSPGNDTVEDGYNTDGRGAIFDSFDANNSPQFTRSLNLNDVVVTDIGGTNYLQFLLDINEPNATNAPNGANNPLLSLSDLRVYLGTAPDLEQANPDNLGTLVYNLDTGGDNVVELRDLQPGSGVADYTVAIPQSAFTAAFNGTNPWIYLYSNFGNPNAATGGFEEWALRTQTPPVIPLPAAVWMGLSMLGGMGVLRLRKGAKKLFA
jgi:hypothetical protein